MTTPVMSKPEGSKCVCSLQTKRICGGPFAQMSGAPTQACGNYVKDRLGNNRSCLHDEACHAAPESREGGQ